MPRLAEIRDVLTQRNPGAAADPAAPVVFWDGYGLDQPRSGVFEHASHLARGLEHFNVFPAIVGREPCTELFPELPVYTLRDWPVLGRAGRLKPLWPQRVGRAVHRGMVGYKQTYVVHGLSNFNVPLLEKSPSMRRVVTIHDLIPFLAPSEVSTAYRLQLAAVLPQVMRVVDRVVCVSEWTRAAVVTHFPFAEEKCEVIPNGVPERKRHIRSRRNTGGEAIEALYVARFETYKRHDFLLRFLRKTKLPLRLTMVTDALGADFMRKNSQDLLAANRLVVKTAVPAAELGVLHQEADVYLHPSRLEGFCLPAVDALLAGAPVVYQPGSGIDEVAGKKAGFPVEDGDDPAAWEAAVETALATAATPGFSALVDGQLAQLPTWKDAAWALKTLYNKLI